MPSGASTGIYEALELRDGDKSRYKGKGPAFTRMIPTEPLRNMRNEPLTGPQLLLLPARVSSLSLSPSGVLKAVGHINDTLAPALIASVSHRGVTSAP